MGPGDLAKALSALKLRFDPNLIMGIERAEDAGIYKLSDELAVIQTVDFFTPIVDDPYSYGQIAAVNALSDVYAKGGKPLTAMNIVCFPVRTMDISVLKEIMSGGLEKIHEAGVVLLGGHSVDDQELKYGLSVTGLIHPRKVVFNNRASAGDCLILTKPIGTGIISTAIKGKSASELTIARVIKSMTTLNRKASELMQEAGVNACTDITGFGLLGHAAEMVEGTDVGMVIYARNVPIFPETQELHKKGFIPGGLHRNREYRLRMVEISKDISPFLQDILFDPQTSGGLLISLPETKSQMLLERMHHEGIGEAAIIGEIISQPKGKILVK